MLFTFGELLDLVIMSAALGYIFHDIFKKPKPYNYDPLHQLHSHFEWGDFLFAMAVTVPAVVLHELGHKFTAMALGAYASFHAAYMWLGIGIIMRLVGFPFVFFVPGYVSISPVAPLSHALIAFAGPGVNLLLFMGSKLLLKYYKFSRNTTVALALTQRINLLLFVFNMLPIPGFDGYKVFSGLISGLL